MSLDWAVVDALPPYVRAAMQALQLDQPNLGPLVALSEKEWRSLLSWLDRQQMTLLFGHACAERAPDWVARRIERNLRSNSIRLQKLRAEYDAIAAMLEAAGIPHTVLKGFTHGPPYVPSSELRPQYDLDLLVKPDDLVRARKALESLGFETAKQNERAPTDHAAPMLRRTGWQWKGDYFDPDIPVVVELHHRLWDQETEGFDIPTLSDPAFEPAGSPSYAAAHALRHLLRGSLKVLHVYELALLLDAGHHHEAWPATGLEQAVVCRLAQCWFGRRLPAPGRTFSLPGPICAWLDRYAASPLTREFQPNKDELWLHFELARDWPSRIRIARRRLAPVSLPGALDGHYDETSPPIAVRAKRAARYAGYVARRVGFHALSLERTALEAVRWSRIRKESSA